jgi:uncharacterized membrane protein YccC
MIAVSCFASMTHAFSKLADIKKHPLIAVIKKVFIETIKRVPATVMGLVGFSLGCLLGIPSALYVALILQIKVVIEVINYLGHFIKKSAKDLYDPTYQAIDQSLRKV